jgi:hypothetical protein
MEILVTIETIVLALLAILVAGLLRSHAEILARLRSEETPPRVAESPISEDPPTRPDDTTAHDITGRTLTDEPIQVAVGTHGINTLLAFLSSGCSTCKGFWDALQPRSRGEIPGSARLVIVVRDRNYESPSKLRELVPPDVPVVMSSAAWESYEIPQYPYFVYVDGPSGEIHGEGTAQAWGQVVSLLQDALADATPQPSAAAPVPVAAVVREGDGRRPREVREDAELEAAGVGPGHPSLYAPPHDPGTEAPSRGG